MKFYFSLLLSITSFISYAQNYSGQYPGAMHFYSVNNGNQIVSIKEDSSRIFGVELIRYPEPVFRSVLSESLIDSSCMFWGGQECLWKKDGITLLGNKMCSTDNSIKYFNYLNDSICINFHVSINDTQTVYSNLIYDVKVDYKCISKDTLTVFGQLDSVIIFSILTKNLAGNYFNSFITGEEIIYTKNVGLYDGFAIDYFPDTLNRVKLEGIRNPNFGFDGLTLAELSDFQVSDQFEIAFNAGPYSYNEFIDIINRMDYLTEVEYTANRIYESRSWNFTTQVYDTIRDTSIILFTRSKTEFIDEYDYNYLGYKKNQIILNGCYSGTAYERNNNLQCELWFCPSMNCYGGSDCFQAQFYNEEFITGIGIFNGLYTTTDMWTPTGYKNLVYLKKGSVECGSSYILSSDEIGFTSNLSIFPNPSNNFITIQTDQNFQNAKIQLTDLAGREVELHPFNQSIQLDISHLSSGIYFVKMISADKILFVQKMIKE